MNKGIYVNDSIHGLIALSGYEKRIISSVGFNRLHDVYQNSTVYMTFPTNRTKRFEHSIGTMKLCSDMFFHSVLNTSPKTLEQFYKIFEKEIGDILEEVAQNRGFCELKLGGITPEKIPVIEMDQFRNSLIPNHVPESYQIIHFILIQAIRAAALLHDIGHPPFSHIVEYALKSVYQKYKDQNNNLNQKTEKFLNIMSKYFEDNKKLHEQMGDEISDSILRGIIAPIQDDEAEKYAENLFEVIVLECVKKIFSEEKNFTYLHRIIDSSLDGDRLDYVTRDSINSGINTGKIDYKRLINEMEICIFDEKIYFCMPLKAVNSVEDFIKRRYHVYKDIIYHHRVIKTDYLLEHTVRDLVEKYLNEPDEVTEQNHKMEIPFDISGLWFPLRDSTDVEKSNALSQWNDSWLMTVLRQIYYTEYYRNMQIKPGSPDYILQQQLSELLRNNKGYYSLIKRSENFKMMDDAVKNVLLEHQTEIRQMADIIKEASSDLTAADSEKDQEIKDKAALKFIDELFCHTEKRSKQFILSFVFRRHHEIQIESFQDFINECVTDETGRMFANTRFYDTMILFKDNFIGLNDPIYFYNHTGNLCELNEISGIAEILELDSEYMPLFYIYVLLKEDDDSIIKEKRDELLQQIGKRIGEKLKDRIIEILQ